MPLGDLNAADKEIVATMHNMLVAHWVEAAARAWRSYQIYGRGAVIVDFRSHPDPPDDLPLSGYAQERAIAGDTAELLQLQDLVRGYDPEQEVVFVVYTPLGDTILNLMSALEGRPTPPEAAGQVK
jgi:hypothetical protein